MAYQAMTNIQRTVDDTVRGVPDCILLLCSRSGAEDRRELPGALHRGEGLWLQRLRFPQVGWSLS